MAQARVLLEKAVACDPGYAKAVALIALTHYFDIRFNYTSSKEDSKRELVEHLSNALRLDPEEPYAVLVQANAQSLDGLFDQAVETMRWVVAKCPSDALCWLAFARVLVSAERSVEAEQAIRHAMRLNPHYPINYLAVLGDSLVHQGRSADAVPVFSEIVNRQPNYISAHLHLAGLYSSLGEAGRAAEAVAEVLRINPRYRAADAVSFYLSANESRKRAFLDSLQAAGLPG
jgi:predicted Zn-dependent protease